MELSVHSSEYFMRQALQEAEKAYRKGEIPVGAVVVCRNKIIARAYNQTETLNDVTAHSEMIALTAASNYIGAKYLPECAMYVTLEPCVMCAGALFWAQIGKLVYGTDDILRGYSRTGSNILHPKTVVEKGVLKDECKSLLDGFFKNLRE